MSEDVQPYGGAPLADNNARVEELRSLAASLEMSQRGVARELELDERTMRYYFSGQHDTPVAVLYALRYLAARKSGRITELDLQPGAAITPDLARSMVAEPDAGDVVSGRGRPGKR